MRKSLLLILLPVLIAGCSARSAHDRARVSDTLEGRTGHPLRTDAKAVGTEAPAGIVLEDGLTPDEAVALALWNNAAFQADLAELGIARADLRDAGLLRNPLLTLLFPLGPKQFEATMNLPIDLIWQRPKRVAAAKLNVERVASNLVDHGLNLVRNVLAAHADLDRALTRSKILQENALVLGEIAELTAARERAGDISGLEEAAVRLQAARAAEDAVAAVRDAELTEENLRGLLGLGLERHAIHLAAGPPLPDGPAEIDDLLKAAYAFRPSLRAAELAVEAVGKRLGWEQSRVFTLLGLVDINGEGKEGFEMGPGLQVELPLFNQNQGKTARAREELTQSLHLYAAERQRIAREVREAASRYDSSRRALDIVGRDLLPAAVLAAAGAEQAYARGAISYLALLEFKRRLLEARLREADDIAQLRRAEADLRYSIGFKPMASDEGN
jgi:cobalt-zinc-cadmium efflux system outer membrane protein